MITTSLQDIAHAINGQLQGDNPVIEHVSTDTRDIQSQTLFIALIGERFDAHEFIHQAQAAGAVAALVSRPLDTDFPHIVVDDTRLALGQLATWVHRCSHTPTIGITGSCGKTTVKEMTASILSLQGQVLFTAGNFNNDIGVPLTLLRSTVDDDFAVIEMGANHIGEIAYTTQLVKPDVALVNNVAAAHLEGFGSLDGVKQAKGEIYLGLPPDGIALVNLDSCSEKWFDTVLAEKNIKTFSLNDHSADFFPSDIRLNEQGQASFTLTSPQGSIPITLGIMGQHNVSNALAAAALAMEMGASLNDVQKGLASLQPVKGRVSAFTLTDNVKMIDDSYNASVPAMKAAIDLLGGFSTTRWLILGNMAELGHESLALHRQVGEHAYPFQFEHVLTYGDDTKIISEVCQGQHFATHEDMIAFIRQQLQKECKSTHTLLIKGALSSGMGKIVAALKEIYT
ncbi:MAG: UDP-N-acetylmuramoyl-tripeptide--D-alanyl-D-alanine ligase [Vibrio sp.]